MNVTIFFAGIEAAMAVSPAIRWYCEYALQNNLKIESIDLIQYYADDEPDNGFVYQAFFDPDLTNSNNYYCIIGYNLNNIKDQNTIRDILKLGAHVRYYMIDLPYKELEFVQSLNYDSIGNKCDFSCITSGNKSLSELIEEDYYIKFEEFGNTKRVDEVIKKYKEYNKLIK